MTPDQVLEWAREASEYAGRICSEVDPTPSVEAYRKVFAIELSRLVHNAALEMAAKECEPKTVRPCGCDYCTCGNSTDAESVARWDAETACAAAIRSLKEPTDGK